jgi:archaemetzincin
LKLAAAWLLLPLLFDGGAPAAQAPVSRLVVHLIPLGSISDEMVEKTAEGLRSHVPAIVVVEPRATLASGTEATIPGRYRADNILDWMQGVAEGGPQAAPSNTTGETGKWMGVTDVDIVAKKGNNENWGVLGLGTIDGRCSVLSTFRMKRTWEHGGVPDALVRERLWKTAVHELGHTLGLPHCPVKGCIMEDAHGTVKTTDRETGLCPDCARRFLEAAGL